MSKHLPSKTMKNLATLSRIAVVGGETVTARI